MEKLGVTTAGKANGKPGEKIGVKKKNTKNSPRKEGWQLHASVRGVLLTPFAALSGGAESEKRGGERRPPRTRGWKIDAKNFSGKIW